MFERFTDRARRVVVLAQEEARMLNHDYIGTEHILLGLIHEGEGVACKALQALGVNLDAVRAEVESLLGVGTEAAAGHIPLTKRAKKTFELALREAMQLGHNYVGTEHILLGLLREGEGIAGQVLTRLGADQNTVRREVTRLMAGEKGGPDGVEVARGAMTSIGVRLSSAPPAFDPEAVPVCSNCRATLVESLRFHVVEAHEHEGSAQRRMLLVFCGSCGTVVGSMPASDER